jgi:hypothetical protein
MPRKFFQLLLSYVHAILEIIALSYKLVALHEGRLNIKMAARKALK